MNAPGAGVGPSPKIRISSRPGQSHPEVEQELAQATLIPGSCERLAIAAEKICRNGKSSSTPGALKPMLAIAVCAEQRAVGRIAGKRVKLVPQPVPADCLNLARESL
jgi:hypothetical protein